MRARYVFISPHADDELLSMGAAILDHVHANGPDAVAVVLAGTGEASGARRVLRDSGYVLPGVPGVQRVSLTLRQFVRSRDAEFYDSCRALGVPAGNIYMPGFRLNEDDGSTYQRGSYTTASIPRLARMREGWTVNQAREFVNAVVRHFGPVHYKTQSWADPSQDHRRIGEALRDCRLPVGSRRYYYPPYRVADKPAGAPRLYERYATSGRLPALAEAGLAYGQWGPVAGRYAVGWLSVGACFGGPAAELRRCPVGASSPSVCGRVGSVRAPETPLFDVGRTLMHY